MRKHLTLLWLIPPAALIAGGFLASQQGAPQKIVEKAQTFQNDQAASTTYTPFSDESYDLTINMDESFRMTGEGVSAEGSLRKNDAISIPLTVEAIPERKVSTVRLKVSAGDNGPLLKGFKFAVRECGEPWKPVDGGNAYTCSGGNRVVTSRFIYPGGFFPVKDRKNFEAESAIHLLLLIERSDELILPMGGYKTKINVESKGLVKKL